MRFLSLLAITSIAFCVSMCTPNNSNNVNPVTGNCRDGIQNGDEQGVDCGAPTQGSGVCSTCNGNMAITAAGVAYSTGNITTTNTSGTCYTTNPPTTSIQYPLVIVTPTFYKNGSLSSALSMYFYIKGTPAVKSYSYDNSPYGTYCIGGNINTFYILDVPVF